MDFVLNLYNGSDSQPKQDVSKHVRFSLRKMHVFDNLISKIEFTLSVIY